MDKLAKLKKKPQICWSNITGVSYYIKLVYFIASSLPPHRHLSHFSSVTKDPLTFIDRHCNDGLSQNYLYYIANQKH